MSHTPKTPTPSYTTANLPTDLPEGSVVFDSTEQKLVSFKNGSWNTIGGGGVGSTTYVRDNVAGVIDQIQGDIPDNWKNADTSLKGVVIGTSCTSVGASAFNGCSGFTGTLTIPSSVTSINASSFENCSGFTGSLTIPDNVTYINNQAFSSCSGFTALSIGKGLTNINVLVFNGCSGFTGTLTIPNTVTAIGNYTFQNCSGFTALSIGNSLTSIGSFAFNGCSGFTGTLTIPSNVTAISTNAFSNCSSFTRIEIDNSTAPTIGASAFQNVAPSDGNIHVPVGATGYAASYDGYTVVYDL